MLKTVQIENAFRITGRGFLLAIRVKPTEVALQTGQGVLIEESQETCTIVSIEISNGLTHPPQPQRGIGILIREELKEPLDYYVGKTLVIG